MSIISQSRVTLMPALGGSPPADRQLDFTCERQSQSQWCWAAVAVSVARFYRSSNHWTQCALASAELHQAACCSSATPCNRPWYLDRALDRVGHADGPLVAGALSFAELSAELSSGEPVAVRIGWRGGGGHFVVVEGYSTEDEQVDIEDPNEGPTQLSYATLCADYGGAGAWTHSYRTRR